MQMTARPSGKISISDQSRPRTSAGLHKLQTNTMCTNVGKTISSDGSLPPPPGWWLGGARFISSDSDDLFTWIPEKDEGETCENEMK